MTVDDPIIARFAEACGATGPLELEVDLAEGGVLARGAVAMPFTLVGRDDACDVILTDAEVNPRHAWLQVVRGRVYVVDLGSRTGLGWPDGRTGNGWLVPNGPVRIGPFLLKLRALPSPADPPLPLSYNPLQSDPDLDRTLPPIVLEFRNGRRARDRWKVNRVLTLVGRAPECKIHLTAEDIAGYHCGLVWTPGGLWVVDLSGRGVVVNGERMRVAPLTPGSELWVGRFLIGVQVGNVLDDPATGRDSRSVHLAHGRPSPPPSEPVRQVGRHYSVRPPGRGDPAHSQPDLWSDDEVPLGVIPPVERSGGLPSSHILSDVDRLWPGSGLEPASEPLVIDPAHSTPSLWSPPPPRPTTPPLPARPGAAFGPSSGSTIRLSADESAEVVLALVKQLGELHAQMAEQFQQSLVLLAQLFTWLRRNQLPAVQRELARILELNTELARLQGEVAQRAVSVVTTAGSGEDLPEWVRQRVGELHRERQQRWRALAERLAARTA